MSAKRKFDPTWSVVFACFLLCFFCLGFCSGNKGLYLAAILVVVGFIVVPLVREKPEDGPVTQYKTSACKEWKQILAMEAPYETE